MSSSGRFPASLRKLPVVLPLVYAAFAAVVILILKPLHSSGIGQPVIRWLIGLHQVLLLPGGAIVRSFVQVTHHHITQAQQCVMVLVSTGFYAGILMLFQYLKRRRLRETTANDRRESSSPGSDSRRQFLRNGAWMALAGLCGGTFGYSLVVEPQKIRVTRRKVIIPSLPTALEGLTLAQLTDLHHGPWLSIGYVRRAINIVNGLHPDLVVLTGDYVLHSPLYASAAISEFASLRPTIGSVAILGNHDWWEGAGVAREAFARVRIPLIDNSRAFVTSDRRLILGGDAQEIPSTGLCIGGVGDLWEDKQDFAAAFRGVPRDMPRILLSHHPDVAEDFSAELRENHVTLMVCGHTHGGQVRLPGLGTPVVPSGYGSKYAQGSVRGPSCEVSVSAGLGTAILPLRFGVPPEIALIELTRG